jgi:hypothetical protein
MIVHIECNQHLQRRGSRQVADGSLERLDSQFSRNEVKNHASLEGGHEIELFLTTLLLNFPPVSRLRMRVIISKCALKRLNCPVASEHTELDDPITRPVEAMKKAKVRPFQSLGFGSKSLCLLLGSIATSN